MRDCGSGVVLEELFAADLPDKTSGDICKLRYRALPAIISKVSTKVYSVFS